MKKIISWITNLFFSAKNENIRKRIISDDEFNDRRAKRRQKLDAILDKISKDGYDSLSNHERNFLDNYGKN